MEGDKRPTRATARPILVDDSIRNLDTEITGVDPSTLEGIETTGRAPWDLRALNAVSEAVGLVKAELVHRLGGIMPYRFGSRNPVFGASELADKAGEFTTVLRSDAGYRKRHETNQGVLGRMSLRKPLNGYNLENAYKALEDELTLDDSMRPLFVRVEHLCRVYDALGIPLSLVISKDRKKITLKVDNSEMNRLYAKSYAGERIVAPKAGKKGFDTEQIREIDSFEIILAIDEEAPDSVVQRGRVSRPLFHNANTPAFTD